jgi:hypothetical protein
MSVVLMGIGVALALPSYRDMVEKRQVTNGAEQLASFINSAQGVAMKTNRFVKVSWDHVDNGEWCVGATAVANLDDGPCDCTGDDVSAPSCAIDGQDFLLNQASASNRDLMQPEPRCERGRQSPAVQRGCQSRDPGLRGLQCHRSR